nr:MAG TPA: hypothetical protein [Caudoviricetes sp.]
MIPLIITSSPLYSSPPFTIRVIDSIYYSIS